jgi:hypothetical protein
MALFVLFVATFGLQLGIVGVALSLALSVIISSLTSFLWAAQLIEVSPITLLKPLVPISGAALIAAIVGYLLQAITIIDIGPWPMLIARGGLLVVLYAGAALLLMPALSSQVRLILRRFLGRTPR